MIIQRDQLPDHLKPLWDAPARDLLRSLLIGEAEGEGYAGMFGVACVVRNRVQLGGWWGDDLKSVVLCRAQFSCMWADWPVRSGRILLALQNAARFPTADQAAADLLDGKSDVTDNCTHYFNAAVVMPSWASHLVHVVDIGHHTFYRDI